MAASLEQPKRPGSTSMEPPNYPTAPPSTAEMPGEDEQAEAEEDDNLKCRADSLHAVEEKRERTMRRLIMRCKSSMGSSLIWDQCCEEVQQEFKALDLLLGLGGLQSHDYTKEKSFPITDYIIAPDLKTCPAKDFLDFYIFPYLLPAIYSLLLYARENQIFQCRVCTFSPLDFIAENLYNYNPWHPDRNENPVPLFEAPFAKKWLANNPRPPLPAWLTMSKDVAALKIQRLFRGYLVRRRPEVQELRQFWVQYKNDLDSCPSEILDEDEGPDIPTKKTPTQPSQLRTHSEQCIRCSLYKCTVHKRTPEIVPPIGEDGKPNIDRASLEAKYKNCCFHPEGHLPFSKHKSEILKATAATSKQLSCLQRAPCTIPDSESRRLEQQIGTVVGDGLNNNKHCNSVEVLYGRAVNKAGRDAPEVTRTLSLQNPLFRPSAQLLATKT